MSLTATMNAQLSRMNERNANSINGRGGNSATARLMKRETERLIKKAEKKLARATRRGEELSVMIPSLTGGAPTFLSNKR